MALPIIFSRRRFLAAIGAGVVVTGGVACARGASTLTMKVDGGRLHLSLGSMTAVVGPLECQGKRLEFASVDAAAGRATLRGGGQAPTGNVIVTDRSVLLDLDVTSIAAANDVVTIARTVSGVTRWNRAPVARWRVPNDGVEGIPIRVPCGYAAAGESRDGVSCWELTPEALDCPRPDVASSAAKAQTASSGAVHLGYGLALFDCGPDGAGGLLTQQAFTLACEPARPFGQCRSGEDASVRIRGLRSRSGGIVPVTLTVRDFDGTVKLQTRIQLSSMGEPHVVSLGRLPVGLHYVDVRTDDGSAVARSNVWVHDAGQDPDVTSGRFGASGLFLHAGVHAGLSPSDWLGLVKVLGMSRLRQTTSAPEDEVGKALTVLGHQGIDPAAGSSQRTAALEAIAADNARHGITEEELGNELNLQGIEHLSGAEYVEHWLKPYRRMAPATQLCSAGMSTFDAGWFTQFADAGGLDQCHAVAAHLSRSNIVPDADTGQWNFWGQMKELMAALRAKRWTGKVYLTEVYGPTLPNSWWSDTERSAAENMLLQAVLAIHAGVERIYWYQVNDGVWFNPDATSETDIEYHYGLTHTDGTLKPSALAVRAAARYLGQATSMGARGLDKQNAGVCGVQFRTPDGPVVALWSRREGYQLNTRGRRNGQKFVSPEPWQSTWSDAGQVTLVASGTAVEIIDCIGRVSTRATRKGESVRITLTGAPILVRGITGMPAA